MQPNIDQPPPKDVVFDAEKAFAHYVQTERERRGWSQRELAERLTAVGMPIHATGVTRLETGKRGVGLNEFIRICEAFGITTAKAFRWMADVDKLSNKVVGLVDEPLSLVEAASTVSGMLGVIQDLLNEALDVPLVEEAAPVDGREAFKVTKRDGSSYTLVMDDG